MKKIVFFLIKWIFSFEKDLIDRKLSFSFQLYSKLFIVLSNLMFYVKFEKYLKSNCKKKKTKQKIVK